MGYKGFQCVEAKPNRRDKNKERSEEHEAELSPTAAAFRNQPKASAQPAKSKLLPGENPIDPKQVKADLKAARSLQKNYANQAAPATNKPKPQQQQKVEVVNMGAWGAVPKATTAAPAASVSIPMSGHGGWGAKSNAGLRGAGVLNEASHFEALPSAGDFKPDVRHAGGARQALANNTTNDATLLWKQAKSNAAKGGNNNKKGGNGQQQQAAPAKGYVAQTLVVGKKVTAPKAEAAAESAGVDELLADAAGAALPISVAPIMLTADGKAKEISLAGSLDKMGTKCEQYIGGMPKNANAVASLPIRGGLFMTVGGKKFSDASTVGEPWMAESYFKALTALLTGEAEEGTATATPYFPIGANGQVETEAPASVAIRIVRANPTDGLFAATTLIELEHLAPAGANRAQLRKVRASFKSFAQGMARAGEAFVNFRETLDEALEHSPLKGAAGAEISGKFAGKFNASLTAYKKALESATA